MTVPYGSKQISNISTSIFDYLIGDANGNLVTGLWNSSQWNNDGLPKYNMITNKISDELLVKLNNALPERQTVTTSIFQDYPGMLINENMKDLDIIEETDIYVTFIDEGAGYKNSVGYYFYYIDTNGIKHILANSDDNVASNTSTYFNPTLIFPNASRKNGGGLKSGGQLIPGMKRKLRGNKTNGKFENIKVGFFLVPNGWYSNTTGVKYNNKEILHSTIEFNPHNNPILQNGNIISNNGLQTILFNTGSGYLLCFEDIKRPGGDSDFNDLIIQIEVETETYNSNSSLIELPEAVIPSGICKTDYFGLFLSIENITNIFLNIDNNNKKYKFIKKLTFKNKLLRDNYITNINMIIKKIQFEYQNISDTVINCVYKFRNQDINNNKENNKLKLYLFKKEDNEEDSTSITSDGKTIYDILVLIQHALYNDITKLDLYLTEYDETINTEIILETDLNTMPTNLTKCLMTWGDPYVTLLDGRQISLPNKNKIYKFLDSANMSIVIDCQLFKDHPKNEYKNTTFVKYCIIKHNNDDLYIEMFYDLDINIKLNNKYYIINTYLTDNIQVLDKNKLDSSNDKIILNKLSSKDKDIKFRIIVINKLIKIWCIIYPNLPDYHNEIFIDKETVNNFKNINGLVLDGNILDHALN